MLRSDTSKRLWIEIETGEFEPVESHAQIHSRKRGPGVPDWWVVAKDPGWRPPRKNAGNGCVSKPNYGGELQACTPDGRYAFDRGSGSGGAGLGGRSTSLLADAGTVLQDGGEAFSEDARTEIWSQSHGVLKDISGQVLETGYAGAGGPNGKGAGRNNPGREAEVNVGPLSKGFWGIEEVKDKTYRTGLTRPIFQLVPDEATRARVKAMGRNPDTFFIHGNNDEDNASTGCIIMNKLARERLKKRGTQLLQVEE